MMSEEFFTFESEAQLKEWQKEHELRIKASRRNLDGSRKLYYACTRNRTNPCCQINGDALIAPDGSVRGSLRLAKCLDSA